MYNLLDITDPMFGLRLHKLSTQLKTNLRKKYFHQLYPFYKISTKMNPEKPIPITYDNRETCKSIVLRVCSCKSYEKVRFDASRLGIREKLSRKRD